MPVQPLQPEQCVATCSPDSFSFQTTAELEPTVTIIGQPRGTRALEFGIGMSAPGYNIYVLGAKGTGRSTAIKRFLERRSDTHPVPNDWVYVHNFEIPYQPRAITLPAGQGALLQARMGRLIADLSHDLPQAFEAEGYLSAIDVLSDELGKKQGDLLQAFQAKAAEAGLILIETAAGAVLAVRGEDGKPQEGDGLQSISAEIQMEFELTRQKLTGELDMVLYQVRQLERQSREAMISLDRSVASMAMQDHFAELSQTYADHDEILLYLNQVHADVLTQIDDFAPPIDSTEEIDLRRYEVNLFVDHSKDAGAPVTILGNPSYHTLFGRIEFEMQQGAMVTHFTDIKPGALHQANGGYLIIDAHDLLENETAWEALKRALKSREIQLQVNFDNSGSLVPAKSLSPEPIPLQIKIVLIGSPNLYYYLYDMDEDFHILFKVRADFEDTMPRDAEHEMSYASFIATSCQSEGLQPFDRSAVAKVVEYGSRLAEDRAWLSARFGAIADLLREADYWAKDNGRDIVTAEDVTQALAERRFRSNYFEEQLQKEILDGTLFIETSGRMAGQVNGLSVFDTGDYTFGQPSRITSRTFVGDGGIVHIERETQMSGPIHDKGVLTLQGYLGGKYAQKHPLSLTASLTFEQTYGGIDGDSASSAELYALLSCLSKIPVAQAIAVTGSFNQHGLVQPIGGVNEKIEGFYEICKARGLTGEQGVVIPASNVANLMLSNEVVSAIARGEFSVWAVRTVDEGIELLAGIPAGEQLPDGGYPEGTVHHAVELRLRELAHNHKSSHDDDDDDADEEE